MGRIFITGSADGLGLLAAKQLISLGHEVVLHARNANRAKDILSKIQTGSKILTGDLSSIEECKALAEKVNATGDFDAVIHNAGVYQQSPEQIFAVNSLAPYILTCLIRRPKRLIYLSSGMHLHGRVDLDHLTSESGVSYSDSKLYVLMLALAVARRWPDVYSNAVDPGWVPTKMGGQGAPDDLDAGVQTQVWLASSIDPQAIITGRYLHHQRQKKHLPEADDVNEQDKFLLMCQKISAVRFLD